MAARRQTYIDPELEPRAITQPLVLGAQEEAGDHQDFFSIYPYALNRKPPEDVPVEHKNKGGIEDEETNKYSFPGNISPEGYFYSPFYEKTLKELDDELQSITTKRINFLPSDAKVISVDSEFYYPEMGFFTTKKLYKITVISPISYDFLIGQPFSIYDIMDDVTYRGHLDGFSSRTNGSEICIATEEVIDSNGLKGLSEGSGGKSRYIISLLEENAPEYAEYIPSTGKLVWRGPKKMSDLSSDSPIYNMPFTNGRHYIHRNLNVFVRRQDPHGGYKLYRPSIKNPLRRFQIAGDAKLDFDYIQQIIDSMVDAC